MEKQERKLIAVTYKLYVPTEEGKQELMESTTLEEPFVFCTGLGMTLPLFEETLLPLNTDDTFDFTIPCAEAYGERNEDYVLDLDKNVFAVDGKIDEKVIFEGNTVPLMDSEGNRFNASILTVGAEKITVDLNHPLAGEDLHFQGKVLEARPATEDEIEAFSHPSCGSGCGSCGCGCGDDDCESHHCGEDCGCGCH